MPNAPNLGVGAGGATSDRARQEPCTGGCGGGRYAHEHKDARNEGEGARHVQPPDRQPLNVRVGQPGARHSEATDDNAGDRLPRATTPQRDKAEDEEDEVEGDDGAGERFLRAVRESMSARVPPRAAGIDGDAPAEGRPSSSRAISANRERHVRGPPGRPAAGHVSKSSTRTAQGGQAPEQRLIRERAAAAAGGIRADEAAARS